MTQRLRDGRIEVVDVPMPALRPAGVLVDVRASLLSAGTERAKVTTGRQSLLGKARSRPDQVRQVMDKARRDGLSDTLAAVRTRLDQPNGLGYSSAGVVIAAGDRVRDLQPGDRVACAGADHALHADVNYVPANLCVRLPEEVSFEEAAFTTVGSIALHGVRQADARLGERIAVIGLGLVGQLAGQILRAAGCLVMGVDLDTQLVARAVEGGAVDRGCLRSELNGTSPPTQVGECDAIIVTAATKSSDPVALAARLARDRARVVVVGDVGLELDRGSYYEKELDLRLSRSYGPGRYDREYEERGLDYPIGYVRWTERRNMEAFVELMATRRVDVTRLITESVDVDEAPTAYDRIAETHGSRLGVLFRYEPTIPPPASADEIECNSPSPRVSTAGPTGSRSSVGVIGAGSFAQRILIPSLRQADFKLTSIASATGLSAAAGGARFGFELVDTVDNVIADPRVGLVVIATRHATHAELAERALWAGKDVFVEKPPAITSEQLARLRNAREATGRMLVVGFNRRQAPLAERMRAHFGGRGEPMELLYRINAGKVDSDHWINDLDEGGGRLIGEGCHFVDFACWMIEALPTRVSCAMTGEPSQPLAAAQRFVVSLSFADGSIATILYGVGGSSALAKEYVEAHAGDHSALLHNFRRLVLYEGRRANKVRLRREDKGHLRQAMRLRQRLAEGSQLDQAPDPLATMSVTLAALQSGQENRILCTEYPVVKASS